MLAVLCRTVIATSALWCGQPMAEAEAAAILRQAMEHHSSGGFGSVSELFMVREYDQRWLEASQSHYSN